MASVIEVEDLTRTFSVTRRGGGLRGALAGLIRPATHDVRAVDRVSFRIAAGERVAFVGPNGAGKSTTIKILSGILHPSSGRATVAGFEPWSQRRRLAYRIGTVFGQRSQLWYHLPAADTFELLAHVYDQEPRRFARRRDTLVELFGIGDHLDRPVRQLSLGQRMRCEIVASLLHDPRVLFLDEPTIGLDVAAKATIRDVIRAQSEEAGRTVLLTSHDTGDMERVCDRVIVIHHGRVLLDESIETLRSRFIRRKLVTVRTVQDHVDLEMSGVTITMAKPHRAELEVDLDVTSVEAVVARVMRSTSLRDLTITDPPMDEIVQTIYRRADAELRAATGTS